MAKFLVHSHSFGRVVNSPTRPPGVAVRAYSPNNSCGERALDSRKVLGVSPNASKREVKAAYRKLALQFHPDVIRGDQESCDVSFTEVNRAYESLITTLEDESNGRGGAREGEEEEEEEEEEWADFLHGLVDEYQPREDFSSYYSNLKLYSKGRKYQYYQGNW